MNRCASKLENQLLAFRHQHVRVRVVRHSTWNGVLCKVGFVWRTFDRPPFRLAPPRKDVREARGEHYMNLGMLGGPGMEHEPRPLWQAVQAPRTPAREREERVVEEVACKSHLAALA